MQQDDNADARRMTERAWSQIYAFHKGNSKDQAQLTTPCFIDYAWNNFDAKIVIDCLMHVKPTYKALHPILFAGLCAWVICPTRLPLQRHAMLLVGIDHLRKAEALGRAKFAAAKPIGYDMLGDIFAKLRLLGPDFFADFYYPIGGLTQVLKSPSRTGFARNLGRQAQPVHTIVAVMQVFDYHARHLNNDKLYYPPSRKKGIDLVQVVHGRCRNKTGFSVDLSNDRWGELNMTAAMIYAASTIYTDDGLSLLDSICQGRASFEKHGGLLGLWISRARYASIMILGKFTNKQVGQANAEPLPGIPLEETPEPYFTSEERALIEAKFNMHDILAGRRQTERRSIKHQR